MRGGPAEGIYRPVEHEDRWLSGLLTGVTDPDATNGAADSLSFDAAAPAYTTPNVTLTSVTLGTCTTAPSRTSTRPEVLILIHHRE